MAICIDYAQPDDAGVIATMVGELLHEIMAAVEEKAFGFHQDETTARTRTWIKEGKYTVLLACDGPRSEPLGFLALYDSYALYTEGAFGTIPEFFVRPTHRSKGVGTALLTEANRLGRRKGWRRLEVTTPPLPQFERTLAFYQRHGFSISGGRKLKAELQ
jgi:GNAT superfamily N-acetyltransferase